MLKIKPLADYVVVRPILKASQTASGLYLPEKEEKKAGQGEVMAVGPGRCAENGNLMPMQLKVGQTVVFRKYAPDDVELSADEKYMIVKESDVMAIIE